MTQFIAYLAALLFPDRYVRTCDNILDGLWLVAVPVILVCLVLLVAAVTMLPG